MQPEIVLSLDLASNQRSHLSASPFLAGWELEKNDCFDAQALRFFVFLVPLGKGFVLLGCCDLLFSSILLLSGLSQRLHQVASRRGSLFSELRKCISFPLEADPSYQNKQPN